MKSKAAPYVFLLFLGLAAFLLARRNRAMNKENVANKASVSQPSAKVNRNRGFDRRVSYIEYTNHAKCRMECRKITQAEVQQIMKEGTINFRKSDVKAKPCPEYALEGVTDDQQKVRIVFAQCDTKSKVITAIDLDTEWTCHCPGDEKKN